MSTITAAAALLGLIAMIVISNRYDYALENYGFAQGDIGKAMFEFADVRSSLRAAIGYDDADAIDTVVQQHKESKAAFEKSFAEIENTIVSEEGRKTYDEIKEELNDYWQLDSEIMELGATNDKAKSAAAQEIALNELAGPYNSIYSKLDELLEVKVEQGNSLSTILMITGWALSAIILAFIIASMVLSTKLGRKIARRISVPLGSLGERFKTFSAGDLASPFPMIETGDEVEMMEKDAKDMAENLDAIIFDIDKVLGEMANGNYTVRSKAADRYTGDFQKLYASMHGLREQMTKTLISIVEASNQVSAGSGELALHPSALRKAQPIRQAQCSSCMRQFLTLPQRWRRARRAQMNLIQRLSNTQIRQTTAVRRCTA